MAEAEPKKRIEWEEVYMGIALVTSQRSPDKQMKAGACVLDADNKVIGVGYNGSPIGGNFDAVKDKHETVVHAEANAIIHSSGNLKGGTVYTTLHPCFQCAKVIVQSGIKKVVYLEKKDGDNYKIGVAEKIFQEGNIQPIAYHKMMKNILGEAYREVCKYSEKVQLTFIPWNYKKDSFGNDERVRLE